MRKRFLKGLNFKGKEVRKMKKFIFVIALVGLLLWIPAGSSEAFLLDWQLDIDQAGGYAPVTINEYIDTTGQAYIVNTFTSPTTFTFQEWGFFTGSYTHDGGTPFPWLADYELTAIFSATGSGTLGGAVNFNPGGYLKIYSDGSPNYGSATASPIHYGANDGNLIGEFRVNQGSGVVDTTGVPNGQFTLILETFNSGLAANTWFDSSNNDLSGLPLTWVLGYSTTNASYVVNPGATLVGELGDFSGVSPINNAPPLDLIISGNGQWRMDVVPEPGTMLLFGTGLIGLAGAARRKLGKKK